MSGVWVATAVFAAFAAGLAAALVVLRGQRDQARRLAHELRRDAEARDAARLSTTIDTVVAVANERLQAHADRGSADLDARKGLIDQQLEAMRAELGRVTGLVRELEASRSREHGQLAGQIAAAGEQTAQLAETTRQLREALSSTKARGQWGERMAEDVLRLAGFVENVNYRKQSALADGAHAPRGVPDFTFLLPQGLQLHMDVKFPLDNYLRYLQADHAGDRERYRSAFLRDVRDRVRDLAARGYLEGSDCVDCLLLFIPNEQLYAFVQEQDAALLDTALRSKIVLCSPLTLFAVLAVIRQSVDSFLLERTSDEILSLLGSFSRQWGKYTEATEKLGRRLAGAQKDYEDLVGTRRRALERPLERLEDLRRQRDLPAAGDDGEPVPLRALN